MAKANISSLSPSPKRVVCERADDVSERRCRAVAVRNPCQLVLATQHVQQKKPALSISKALFCHELMESLFASHLGNEAEAVGLMVPFDRRRCFRQVCLRDIRATAHGGNAELVAGRGGDGSAAQSCTHKQFRMADAIVFQLRPALQELTL